MNNGIYVIMELKLQNHFLHVTSKQQGICVKKKQKNVSKNEKRNVKLVSNHHQPVVWEVSPCRVWPPCPRYRTIDPQLSSVNQKPQQHCHKHPARPSSQVHC